MKEYVTVVAHDTEELKELLNTYAKKRFHIKSHLYKHDMDIVNERHFAIMERENPESEHSDRFCQLCKGIPIERMEQICKAERCGGLLILPGGGRIEALNLSARSYNCLKDAGYNTISELMQIYDADLQMIKNLGRVSFCEVKEKLHAALKNGIGSDEIWTAGNEDG